MESGISEAGLNGRGGMGLPHAPRRATTTRACAHEHARMQATPQRKRRGQREARGEHSRDDHGHVTSSNSHLWRLRQQAGVEVPDVRELYKTG
jgi:hypothetical protein